MSRVYESTHPLVRHKLTFLRRDDTGVRRFRELVWELTTLLAYEALADLTLSETTVTTPLDEATGEEKVYKIVPEETEARFLVEEVPGKKGKKELVLKTMDGTEVVFGLQGTAVIASATENPTLIGFN